jgi:tRNA/rRNA methyltransferase
MPGAGTDKTKRWIAAPAPVIVLVEPQLGENVGSAARAMANFGLSELRLVNPREKFPNARAKAAASGADRVLDAALVVDSIEAAIADCTQVFATTARAHDQAKPVVGAEEAARLLAPHVAASERAAIMFGRERWGLENDEIALADRIITLPVNPAFASLNLAQAVVIVGYEWFKLATGGALPFAMPQKSAPAPKEQLFAFFASIERELDKVEFFRPPEKKATMLINLRNIFHRMSPTQQDIQTLHGVITAIAEGRKGPARGGVLDGGQAEALRALRSEQAERETPRQGPLRGLSRLLRRNPTDAERALWEALTKDRRFAGRGFKRQVPIGPHIADLVSFPLRTVVEIVPAEEKPDTANARAARNKWLRARGYTVNSVDETEIERDLAAVIDRLL